MNYNYHYDRLSADNKTYRRGQVSWVKYARRHQITSRYGIPHFYFFHYVEIM